VNRRRTIAVVMTAVLIAAVGASQYWVLRGRVATVEPGRLYRSALLSPDRLLDVCRRHGITTVVDFRKEPEEARAEAEVLARAGIRHVNLPTGQVPSAETVAQFLRLMDTKRDEPVLIHCSQGVGRTGVFGAIYRMEYQGWPRWRAIADAAVFAGFGSFGPRNPKTTFLWGYTPRRSRRTP
jgi:protein tyrosine/serine phosphatase